MTDLAAELAVGKRVHGKTHRLALLHLTDVGLVHRQHDLHPHQIFGNFEQHRRLQTGGNGLPRFDGTTQHHTVDRRNDHGAAKIQPEIPGGGLLLTDLRLCGRHLRPRLIAHGLRLIQIAARHQLLLHQRGFARVVELSVAQSGLRRLQVGAGAGDGGVALRDLRLESAGIDAGDHLPFAHPIIEVRQYFGDFAGHLAAHIHGGQRAERAGGRNRDPDIALLHLRGAEALGVGAAAAFPEPQRDHQYCKSDHGDDKAAREEGTLAGWGHERS